MTGGIVRKFQTGTRCRVNGTEMVFRRRGDIKFLDHVDIELLTEDGDPLPQDQQPVFSKKGDA